MTLLQCKSTKACAEFCPSQGAVRALKNWLTAVTGSMPQSGGILRPAPRLAVHVLAAIAEHAQTVMKSGAALPGATATAVTEAALMLCASAQPFQ